MLEIKNTIVEKEKKNTPDRLNSIFETTEENTSEVLKYSKWNKRAKELKSIGKPQ